MNVDDYRLIAVKVGLPLQFVIKEYAMFGVLSGLVEHFNWPLVGGTAINRVYLKKLGRFSEDLDFEVYGKRKLELPQINSFKLAGPFVYRRNVRFEYSYESLVGKDKIRVDINLKPSINIETENKILEFLTGGVVSTVKTLALEGLIARKLFALLYRVEGKDVYDIWNCKNLVRTDKLRNELLVLLSMERERLGIDDFLSAIINKLQKINVKQLSKANQYIPISSRIDLSLAREDILLFLEKLYQ